MTPDEFANLVVGRRRSGAPIMRAPSADNAALAADDLANNQFEALIRRWANTRTFRHRVDTIR